MAREEERKRGGKKEKKRDRDEERDMKKVSSQSNSDDKGGRGRRGEKTREGKGRTCGFLLGRRPRPISKVSFVPTPPRALRTVTRHSHRCRSPNDAIEKLIREKGSRIDQYDMK